MPKLSESLRTVILRDHYRSLPTVSEGGSPSHTTLLDAYFEYAMAPSETGLVIEKLEDRIRELEDALEKADVAQSNYAWERDIARRERELVDIMTDHKEGAYERLDAARKLGLIADAKDPFPPRASEMIATRVEKWNPGPDPYGSIHLYGKKD